jgi:predicted phosphodiesterase
LDELVARSGAALWIHGHTHVSQDYRIGNTRVICNPRGYAGYELNPAFDPRLIIEV